MKPVLSKIERSTSVQNQIAPVLTDRGDESESSIPPFGLLALQPVARIVWRSFLIPQVVWRLITAKPSGRWCSDGGRGGYWCRS